MNRVLVLAPALLAACTAAQSARVVAPDKTTISVGASRTTETGTSADDDSVWGGQVMVRHGLGSRVDGGLTLARTPGEYGAVAGFGLDGRAQLTPPDGKVVVTLGGMVGLLWSEDQSSDGFDVELGGYALGPTLHLGFDLSSRAELVVAPRVVVLIPDEDADSETVYSVSLGVRLHDEARTWALHPELVYSAVADDEGRLLTLGLAISAGN